MITRLLPWVCAELFLLTVQCTAGAGPVIPSAALVLERVGHSGRSPVHTDALEAKIISGNWRRPLAGDRVELPGGSFSTWRVLSPGKDGWFSDAALRGGYAYFPVLMDRECVVLLEAEGDTMVYVNGEPRAGDPYATGYVHLPVSLHRGTNDLLFLCGRGRLKFSVVAPENVVGIDLSDQTMPDLVSGRKMDAWGAVVIINATPLPQRRLAVRSTLGSSRSVVTELPEIPPLTVRKVPVRLKGKAPETGEKVQLELQLLDKAQHSQLLQQTQTFLRVRRPEQTQKRTFISEIDGSVQYWALNPAQPVQNSERPPALFLSVHGAGVEAIGQADAYSPKTWGHLAAPTNRRPYGFDWEAWGRLDALEVLAQAVEELHPDPQRIYLTGHSMGGHGVWQLGALFPDHFAAIGPSAGWISFASYAGGRWATNDTPIEAMLQRASATSDTLALATNYLQEGVYILHGAVDDNVPVSEARHMAEVLSRFHPDFQYHEQPGVGHWWDISDEPGADCVDWAPMFDLFAHHMIPSNESLRQINFTTVNPGVSASCHWLEIQQQTHALGKSVANIRWDPGKRRFSGVTENVARLALSLHGIKPDEPLNLELDGQKLEQVGWPANASLALEREADTWRVAAALPADCKNPLRYGPFKDAFRHRMLMVYGTTGSPEENAWAFAKARFDAESFWYRGNGSVEVISDRAFDPGNQPDRCVILYGNADSNSAWQRLLRDSPVQVRRGQIQIGSRLIKGQDQACLFLRPRPGSKIASVAVVTGSGLIGMRLTDRLPYFLSGVDYPDCTVIGPEMLREGSKGVRAAGFFGLDWSLEKGEFAWGEPDSVHEPRQ